MVHKVVIYKHGGKYWLAGGQLAIKQMDIVCFYNSCISDKEKSAAIAVVTGDNDPDQWPSDRIEIAPNETGEIQFETDGWFPYTVKIDGQEAEASKPIVIVYP